jgi:hypothetical protein
MVQEIIKWIEVPGWGVKQRLGVVRGRSRSSAARCGLKKSHTHKPKRDTAIDVELKV